MDKIKERFEIIEDTRNQGYVEHKLSDILTIVMCAVLCGLDQLSEIASYAKNKSEFLSQIFSIEKIPSKSTFCRVLNMVDGNEVSKIIIEIMKENVLNLGEIVSVDGKCMRSTSKRESPNSALQILTAYFTESSVVLGQESIHEKTNEIPVFQEMLDHIDISGKIITADALHCQKETCKKIIAGGGNYVLGLKENHKNFYDDIELFMKDESNRKNMEIFTALNKNSGRIEKRICYKILDIDWLSCKNEWSNLNSVFAVERIIETKHGTSNEVSFYISSLLTTAENLLRISREHWKIESMHWLLDVVFSEDDCRIISENGLKTLNIFRKLALFIHKKHITSQTKKQSLKSNMFDCLLNNEKLLKVISSL